MGYWEAFWLGLVQGLGEFLPISSSAHLVILPWFVQFKDPGLAFNVALHLGTLLAVVVYFWKDWWNILTKSIVFTFKPTIRTDDDYQYHFRLLMFLILATIPAALAGVLLNEWAETTLRNPLLVAFNMIFLGAVLLFVDRKLGADVKSMKHMTLKRALAVGFAQCFALFPGVSRSGVTMTAALGLGFSRTEAARFSFLMSTPIIFGAALFKYKYFGEVLHHPEALLGILVAAISGFLSIKYLMKLVQVYSYSAFCYYRFVFGIVVFGLYAWRTF